MTHAASRPLSGALGLLVLVGCWGSESSSSKEPPSPFTLLTTGNPDGEDDDPAVALDAQGNLHVVWFSDRDGSKDLYYARSTSIDPLARTIDWTPELQITHLDPMDFPPPTQGDNYPSLFIDADGTLNVAWHRWNLFDESHVMLLRSDGTPAGWAGATEVNVTRGANFDQFPRVVRFAPDDLRVYFASTTRKTLGVYDLFVARSTDDGASFAEPTEVVSLNEATQQSAFAWVEKVSASSYVAVLDRWTIGLGFLDPSTDVYWAESSDGESWTVETVSVDPADDQVDFTPAPFFDHGGAAHVVWASTAFGDPLGDVVELPAEEAALYPASAKVVNPARGSVDHSPRVVALTVGGEDVFVMIWVRIVNGHNQVGYAVLPGL
jgi:hypothetical protein